jgi:sigma-E factor negative regulatory protein RseB
VLDGAGGVLETSAFSDVAIGVRPQPQTVLQPMRRLAGYRVVRPTLRPTVLESEGWVLRPAPGFTPVSCVQREMQGGGEGEGHSSSVLQAIYADGMTYVSVFIEPFDGRRPREPALTTAGATQSLSARRGDWWVTVIGDAPAATLGLFASGLERRK